MDIYLDRQFPNHIGALILETFLYGLYTTLFSICIYSLLRQRRNLHWIFPAFAFAMYSVATADMLYSVMLCFRKFLKGTLSYQDLRLKYWLHVTNTILADSLLLYRCYVIWNHRKRIVIGPALLLITSSVVGYLFEGSASPTLLSKSWVYLMITLILNVILNVLTAGRIWWVSRAAKNVLDPGILQQSTSVVNTIIESGIIYSLYVIINLALYNSKGGIEFSAGLVQVAGIMPTLIIVQLSIRRAIQDVDACCGMSPMKTKPVCSSNKSDPRSRNSTSTLDAPYPIVQIQVDSSHQTFNSSDGSLKMRDQLTSNELYSPPENYRSRERGEAVDRVVTPAEQGGAIQQLQTDLKSGPDIEPRRRRRSQAVNLDNDP